MVQSHGTDEHGWEDAAELRYERNLTAFQLMPGEFLEWHLDNFSPQLLIPLILEAVGEEFGVSYQMPKHLKEELYEQLREIITAFDG